MFTSTRFAVIWKFNLPFVFLFLIFLYAPPFLSTLLHIHVYESIAWSKASVREIGLSFTWFILINFIFPLCIFMYTRHTVLRVVSRPLRARTNDLSWFKSCRKLNQFQLGKRHNIIPSPLINGFFLYFKQSRGIYAKMLRYTYKRSQAFSAFRSPVLHAHFLKSKTIKGISK